MPQSSFPPGKYTNHTRSRVDVMRSSTRSSLRIGTRERARCEPTDASGIQPYIEYLHPLKCRAIDFDVRNISDQWRYTAGRLRSRPLFMAIRYSYCWSRLDT